MGIPARCPECGENYSLPSEFRSGLGGKAVRCVVCGKPFEPLPDKSIKKIFRGQLEILPIDIGPYRDEPSHIDGPESPAPAANAAPATADPSVPPTRNDLGEETVPDRAVIRPASPERMLRGPSMFLIGIEGAASGRTFKIEKSRIIIGRTYGDLQIADPKASRAHAQVDVTENGQILIRDLASTNGTTVSGNLITVARLETNMVIGIGDSKLRLVIKS